MYSVVGSDGQTYGPVNPAQLQAWINEGRINATTEVVDAVTGDRKKLADVSLTTGLTFPVATPPGPTAVPTMSAPRVDVPSNQYAGFSPAQTFTRQMQTSQSSKSKLLAALLAFFLGGLGVHRFYLGHTSTGGAMLGLTILAGVCFGLAAVVSPAIAILSMIIWVVLWIWQVVDFIMILTGGLTDASGQVLGP